MVRHCYLFVIVVNGRGGIATPSCLEECSIKAVSSLAFHFSLFSVILVIVCFAVYTLSRHQG